MGRDALFCPGPVLGSFVSVGSQNMVRVFEWSNNTNQSNEDLFLSKLCIIFFLIANFKMQVFHKPFMWAMHIL